MRFNQAPNKRIQDGIKRRWLCESCEQKFSQWEKRFAEEIFHPLDKNPEQQASYNSWLLKFCVSVSWRVLHLLEEKATHPNDDQRAAAENAKHVWRSFLLDEIANPREFEQHLLVMGVADRMIADDLPTNMNRYLLRSIAFNIHRGENAGAVFSKIGRFILLGFFKKPSMRSWEGTKVRLQRGKVDAKLTRMPRWFFSVLAREAQKSADLANLLSARQQEIIDQAILNDTDRAVKSASLVALSHDYEMFGPSAFLNKRDSRD